ncbi:hypothetical protein ACFE04_007066 [Oxalis oulophora]
MDNNNNNNNNNKILRLKCAVQNYEWGKIGYESAVANMYSKNSGTKIQQDKPYAELWMGTHDSGPSYINNPNAALLTLKSWIVKNPDFALGHRILHNWGPDLPFLFKIWVIAGDFAIYSLKFGVLMCTYSVELLTFMVLSVAKALSIQAHPDKELAKTLHKLHPNAYKDANHKPEMALAITQFEVLCGFLSLQELKNVLHDVPEIVELVGTADANKILHVSEDDGEDKVKFALQSVFTQLMTPSKEMTAKAISKLKIRLNMECQKRQLTEKEQLVLQLEKQYPADIGVISAFFFNYVKLNPGEALYLAANELHAYLSGECIECMATSDNVVRAGLTPKFRDVQTLCSMLTYKQGSPEILRGFTLNGNPYIRRYQPPFDEFEVDRCILPQGASTVFPAIPSPSIYIVTVGEGVMYTGSSSKEIVTEGDVLFTAANIEIVVAAVSELQMYRAGVNSRFFNKLAASDK